MFREESNQPRNTQGVISCRVRTEGSWSPRTKPCQLRTWPCVITIKLPPFHQSSFKEHPTWYTILPPSCLRISKACNLFFSSSGQCFAQVSGFFLLLISLLQQRRSATDQIQPHPLRNSLPSWTPQSCDLYACIHVSTKHTQAHTYVHKCTYVCTSDAFYAPSSLPDTFFSVLPSTLQVDIITKEETGLVRYRAKGYTQSQDSHQVGQPPNLVLFELQKLAYKIPLTPSFCSPNFCP